MCGISGVYSQDKIDASNIEIVRKMNAVLRHRGPDDEGVYAEDQCVLGHTRLSIIDLSSDGHQPFSSDDGRYQLVYNGEIYNYIELREELKAKGWKFKTKTDTEVLLKAYQEYGRECLHKFNGMFAFLIYDIQEKKLFVARDRVGIKPLYYVNFESSIYFASEIKAFKEIPGLRFSMDELSVFDYFVFNRTDVWDRTFFNEIKRFPKGFCGECCSAGFNLEQWWNPEEFLSDVTKESPNTIISRIEELLVSSVKFRMRSDVPVGSCLSGGLDSSTLLGILMQNKMAGKDYLTFTASFPGESFDETSYVDALQRKYEFQNFRTVPLEDELYSGLESFLSVHDEPTLNTAYYAQYSVMRLARENGVTVLLDGQGGDENFAGYPYFLGFHLLGLLNKKKYGSFVSGFVSAALRKHTWDVYKTLFFQLLPDCLKKKVLLESVPFLSNEMFSGNIEKSLIYKKFFDVKDLNQSIAKHFSYKLEHLLKFEDRSSMKFSIETRVPFLDHRLIEYLLRVSGEKKVKRGEIKYLQKLAVGQYVAQEILDRKDKRGFDTPMHRWMNLTRWRTLLKEGFEDLKKSFPHIFVGDYRQVRSSALKWKIIQLSMWKKLYLS